MSSTLCSFPSSYTHYIPCRLPDREAVNPARATRGPRGGPAGSGGARHLCGSGVGRIYYASLHTSIIGFGCFHGVVFRHRGARKRWSCSMCEQHWRSRHGQRAITQRELRRRQGLVRAGYSLDPVPAGAEIGERAGRREQHASVRSVQASGGPLSSCTQPGRGQTAFNERHANRNQQKDAQTQ